MNVSILILLDYLFLYEDGLHHHMLEQRFQSLFYWITYSYDEDTPGEVEYFCGFNPYFIGLPILINIDTYHEYLFSMFQSLFYWITYSYY